MEGMVSVVPLEPPEHLELMEEMVIWAHLDMMEEMVFLVLAEQMEEMEEMEEMVHLVLVEQVEEMEEMVLWALQVFQQDWTWKEFATL